MRLDVFDSFFHYHCFEFVTKESVQDFKLFHEKSSLKEEIAYHQHDLFELYYPISGNITFYVNGNDYILSPGDFIAISPGELHMQIFKEETAVEMMILLVNRTFFEELSTKNVNIQSFFKALLEKKLIHIHPDGDMSDSIKSSIKKLERAYNSTKEKLRYDYFLEFLYLINNIFTSSESYSHFIKPNTKISSILDYIDNNLNNDLSLNVISNKFFISKYHLLREFTKYNDSTLHQYILQKRLTMAKRLIDTGQTLDMVYRKCGFESYSTFSNAFKKKFGINPKKYSTKDN